MIHLDHLALIISSCIDDQLSEFLTNSKIKLYTERQTDRQTLAVHRVTFAPKNNKMDMNNINSLLGIIELQLDLLSKLVSQNSEDFLLKFNNRLNSAISFHQCFTYASISFLPYQYSPNVLLC